MTVLIGRFVPIQVIALDRIDVCFQAIGGVASTTEIGARSCRPAFTEQRAAHATSVPESGRAVIHQLIVQNLQTTQSFCDGHLAY